jgi:hypothetical protein
MRGRDAKKIAEEWVREIASKDPAFRGAFFSGSIITLAPDAELPPTSDVDVLIVVDAAKPPPKLGKILYHDVILEITFVPLTELADVEHVASTFYLAPCFARDEIVVDPTGRLRELHDAVAATFTQPSQILRRCESVLARMEDGLNTFDNGAPWSDQILRWLFPASLSAVVVLVAGGENPTVRSRYVAAKKLLYRYAMTSAYEGLLEILGCHRTSRGAVQHHFDALIPIFDAAARVGLTALPYSSDITPIARPVAIDGTQAMIDAGHHREAIFWLLATYSRCLKIFEVASVRDPAILYRCHLHTATSDLLNIDDSFELARRREQAIAFLPTLRRLTSDIVNATEI